MTVPEALRDVTHLLKTAATNILVSVDANVVRIPAKDARRLVLFEDDLLPVDVDFERIFLGNLQGATQLDGNHDASQFVHLTDDACGLHTIPSFDKIRHNFQAEYTKISIPRQGNWENLVHRETLAVRQETGAWHTCVGCVVLLEAEKSEDKRAESRRHEWTDRNASKE